MQIHFDNPPHMSNNQTDVRNMEKRPPPPTQPHADDGVVLFHLDIRGLPPALRADLEANAHLQRTTPPKLIARLIAGKFEALGIKLTPAQ